MSQPQALTVVVPVFNEAATLRASLERLLKAKLPLPIEVIVVDDGSTDGVGCDPRHSTRQKPGEGSCRADGNRCRHR
jgi:GT2 family glycosyltransferase